MFFLMLFVVMLSGMTLCIQSAVNGRLGNAVDVLESAWLSFSLGAVVTFIIAYLTEPPHALNLFTVPRWQVTGAFFGVLYVAVTAFAMPQVGTAAATVAVISGQLGMSFLIDDFGWFGNSVLPLDSRRGAAITLLAVALILIYRSNAKTVGRTRLAVQSCEGSAFRVVPPKVAFHLAAPRSRIHFMIRLEASPAIYPRLGLVATPNLIGFESRHVRRVNLA